MAFQISDLNNVLNSSGGVARACHYEVIIEPPAGLNNNQIGLKNLSILCEGAQLPGRSFSTTPQMIYGVTRKLPYGVVYDDLALTFICTDSMVERIFFEKWQSEISSPTNNYFRYYNDYIGRIHILKLDKTNLTAHFVTCEEVWPMTIQPQQLSYGDNDSYLKLDVLFAYRRWISADNFTLAGLSLPTFDRPSVPTQAAPGSPVFNLPPSPQNFNELADKVKSTFDPLGVDVNKIVQRIGDFLGIPFLGI